MATKRIKQLVFNGQAYEFNAANVKNYDDTEVKNRLGVLEAIDHADYVKQIDFTNLHNDFDSFTSEADTIFESLVTDVSTLKDEVTHLMAVDTSKFQTEEQVNTAIQKVVGAAPEALDTLEEIATKLQDNDNVVTAMVTTISNKTDKTEFNALRNNVSIVLSDVNTLKQIDHSKFLTEHQDISHLATKGEVENAYNDVCEAMTQEEYDGLTETKAGKLYLILD